jgi:lipoyl(octanoyl) transferase
MLMVNQSTFRDLVVCDLGMISYSKAWDIQKKYFQLRNSSQIVDILFLCEHPNTFTLGKVAHKENLLFDNIELKEKGIKVFEIDRGGDITYHGPGQIVGYPILNLAEWKKDTHLYLRSLEEVLINTCLDYGIKQPTRIDKYTGVWIENRKICAIGIKVSRWITMHGFAFNVNTDLNLFDGIIPCGIKEKEVTSLNRELNKEISLKEVNEKIVKNFTSVFEYKNFNEITFEELEISITKN